MSHSVQDELAALTSRIYELEQAIRDHRNQKADDRCIEDDDRLYAVLHDGIKCDRRVGSKAEMLHNCGRFIDRRCEEGHWPTYADLERKIAALNKDLEYYKFYKDYEKPEEFRFGPGDA